MTDKRTMEMTVVGIKRNNSGYAVLRLKADDAKLPEILPGQFVNILIPSSKEAFLRRPISVHDVEGNELILMIKENGPGTIELCNSREGTRLNVLLPLGHGFSVDNRKTLLIGGGVGIAPLLYLGKAMAKQGVRPSFLLGGRSIADLMNLEAYKNIGHVYVSTEDGSEGELGFVTNHSVLKNEWNHFAVCGPMPMMKAVADLARTRNIDCEVSLENKMACGLGACLCCVEDTVRGNECTCTVGPVYNINDLKW